MNFIMTTPFDGVPPLANGIQLKPIDIADPETIEGDIRRALQILRIAKRADWLLLDSTAGKFKSDVIAAILLLLSPRRPRVILLGSMFEPNHGLRGLFDRLMLQLADYNIDYYIVQSTEEMTLFPQQWGCDSTKMYLVPYFASFVEIDQPNKRQIAEFPPAIDIFAGGNALRDYDSLIEAAAELSEHRFFIATNKLRGQTVFPCNVEARPVPHAHFVHLMACAEVVVTPIKSGLSRAVGQQTYLNAMLMGKIVIVSEGLGVRDHIIDGVNGKIVSGTPQSYVEVLRWVFDPQNVDVVNAMRIAARQSVLAAFTYERYTERLSNVLNQIIGCESV